MKRHNKKGGKKHRRGRDSAGNGAPHHPADGEIADGSGRNGEVPKMAGVDLDRGQELIRLVRYPAIQTPPRMEPRKTSTILVSLDESRETVAPVVIGADGGVSRSGAVPIDLPERPDDPEEEAWIVEVMLSMPDAKVDPSSQKILLRRSGPSDVAAFKVRPLWQPSVPQERRDTPLLAVFSRRGGVFARAMRMVPVTADPAFKPDTGPAMPLLQGGDPRASGDWPDLYIEMIGWPRAVGAPVDAPDRFLVQVRLEGEDTALVGGDKTLEMTGLDAFLIEKYSKLGSLVPRGAVMERAPAARAAAVDTLRELGAELWRRMPDIVVHRIRALQHLKPRGADVRIQTGDPRIPFELLLVPEDGTGDCGQGAQCEFLGVLHRVSRWHVVSALGVSPEERTRGGKVAVIAPTYQAAALRGASTENESLKKLAGSRYELLSGGIQPLVAALGGAPPSVLHYAGHGEAPPGVLPAVEQYALRLEDGSLDLDTFRQHTAWLKEEQGIGPLVFLNACDIGRAEGAYGFAEGWGPAALQQGAAGFIGGLWLLGDTGAAEFARQFYQRALKGMPVAEALRLTRDSYRTTADPTYMAYVYYGHPQLRISEGDF